MIKRLLACLVLPVLIFSSVGCTTAPTDAPPGPPSYRAGFSPGCDSGYVAAGHPYYRFNKDVTRYAGDSLYKQGWDDGFAQCKGRYEAVGRSMR
jgi:hypothetical protein